MTTASSATGVVRYGESSLADVLPSALAALGVAGERNVLGVEPAECVVVLLVDGLGWQLLRAHGAEAPFLSSLAARPLTAGFPTTTAASLTSLGTGVPPGRHGITGYTTRTDGLTEPVNWLTWRGAYSGRDLIDEQPPERTQPEETAFERAARAGVSATVVSSPMFRGSGLTRAALRGGDYLAAFTAADTATLVGDTARNRRGLVYCYSPDLDLIGHVRGTRSDSWSAQLELTDRGVRMLSDRLPPGTRLLVTGDHGMLDVPEDAKIDYDSEPTLKEGIEILAGEPRARYLHVAQGELEAVCARWTETLGDRIDLITRDEAISHGWFGPVVSEQARSRIGELIALATSDSAVVRRKVESRTAALIGHHGAMTDAEMLVPLLSN